MAALAAAKALGLHVKLLTLTIPHGIGDDVKVIVRKLLAAWKRTTNGKAAKDLRELLGLKAFIRAFEVTYGANGFHPHLHVLLFLDKSWSNASVHAAFSPLWQNACRLAGLPIPTTVVADRKPRRNRPASFCCPSRQRKRELIILGDLWAGRSRRRAARECSGCASCKRWRWSS